MRTQSEETAGAQCLLDVQHALVDRSPEPALAVPEALLVDVA